MDRAHHPRDCCFGVVDCWVAARLMWWWLILIVALAVLLLYLTFGSRP